MSEHSGIAPFAPGDTSRTAADMLDALTGFDGPPDQFLAGLLQLQCRVGGAEAAAILRPGTEGNVDVLALSPAPAQGAPAPPWLAAAIESVPAAAASAQTTVRPLHAPDDLYGGPPKRHLIITPLRTAGPAALAAFVVTAQDPAVLAACRDQLEVTAGLVNLYEMRQALRSRQGDFERLRAALDILPAVNEHDRFVAAAMALCNEAAARWRCERVGLGFLKGRYIQLKAMSHTEKFSRKMKLVQDIEAAMEECLDQDLEVVFPADPEDVVITRAAAELSKRHGPSVAVSLPLRKGGEVAAVLTLERLPGQPFTVDEIESMRLTCDLVTARLVNLFEHDKWFGARAAGSARRLLAAAVGPKHTWKKLIAALVFAAIAFLVLAKGDYVVEAPFVFQATQRQIVAAPFDGYIKAVFVERPDDVIGTEEAKGDAGLEATVLATLQTAELEYKLAAAEADKNMYDTQAQAAMDSDKRAEAQIARAQARKVAAQIALLKHHRSQAVIKSPISGKLVAGELKDQIGAAVKTGDVLFEVAPIEFLRAELDVPEALISDVELAQAGELTTEGHAGQHFEFEVERINPVAELVDQRNVFKVRARLPKTAPWMMPKLKGIAKIRVDRRRYAWIWTRRLVNWLRMKLWI